MPYERDEWGRVCRDIERNERGQQRLLALVTEEDGHDLGDIRNKLKELKAHRVHGRPGRRNWKRFLRRRPSERGVDRQCKKRSNIIWRNILKN